MTPISSKPYFFTYLFSVIIIFIIFLVADLILKNKKKILIAFIFQILSVFLFPNNNWSDIAFCDIHVPATLQKKKKNHIWF